MISKILSELLTLWRLLIALVNKIEATRISTGKTWLLHNRLAGWFLVSAFLLMALLHLAHPLPWGMHLIYAGLYVGLALAAAVLQAIIYRRGHYFRQPKIIP